jgi:hypothetical protein
VRVKKNIDRHSPLSFFPAPSPPLLTLSPRWLWARTRSSRASAARSGRKCGRRERRGRPRPRSRRRRARSQAAAGGRSSPPGILRSSPPLPALRRPVSALAWGAERRRESGRAEAGAPAAAPTRAAAPRGRRAPPPAPLHRPPRPACDARPHHADRSRAAGRRDRWRRPPHRLAAALLARRPPSFPPCRRPSPPRYVPASARVVVRRHAPSWGVVSTRRVAEGSKRAHRLLVGPDRKARGRGPPPSRPARVCSTVPDNAGHSPHPAVCSWVPLGLCRGRTLA